MRGADGYHTGLQGYFRRYRRMQNVGIEENADPLRPSDVNARDARVIQITSYSRRRLTPWQGGRLLKGISDIIP